MKAVSNRRRLILPGLFIGFFTLVVLLLAGCSVKLVSDYDETMDRGITELQKKVEKVLQVLERNKADPKKGYDPARYEDIKADLHVLQVRAASYEKNEATQQQLVRLNDAIDALEERNKEKIPIDDFTLTKNRQFLETIFRSILTLEIAKKRGNGGTATSKP